MTNEPKNGDLAMEDEPIKEVEAEGAPAVAQVVEETHHEPAAEPEPTKVHSLEEIKAVCAGIWAGHNSRFSNLDGKPWPELADGLAVVSKHGADWAVREDFTKRLRHELALLNAAVIGVADGDAEAEGRSAIAARGVVQIIDAGH